MVCGVRVTNNRPRCAVLVMCNVLYEMTKSDKSDATVQARATTVYKLSENSHLKHNLQQPFLLKKDAHCSCHILKIIKARRFQD